VCVYDAKLHGERLDEPRLYPIFYIKDTNIVSIPISMPMRQLKPVTSMAISRAITFRQTRSILYSW